jgi:hypothetical protein
MARLTIQFTPAGPLRRLRVALCSDEDATPREHEQDHRRLVQSLLPGIDLEADGSRGVVVEREAPAVEPQLGCSGGGEVEVIDLG